MIKKYKSKIDLKSELSNDISFLDRDKTFRQYAWTYFAVHADQRLKVFQYFITLETALIAGFLVLFKNDQSFKAIGGLGVLLSLFAFIFWKIDLRTKMLVKIAEQALIELDDQWDLPDECALPNKLALFKRERMESAKLRATPLIYGMFTYSRSFNVIFASFGILGSVTALFCFVYLK